MNEKIPGYRIRTTTEFEIEKREIGKISKEKLAKKLLGEFVKVKGGDYENMLCGFITKVNSIKDVKVESSWNGEEEEA